MPSAVSVFAVRMSLTLLTVEGYLVADTCVLDRLRKTGTRSLATHERGRDESSHSSA